MVPSLTSASALPRDKLLKVPALRLAEREVANPPARQTTGNQLRTAATSKGSLASIAPAHPRLSNLNGPVQGTKPRGLAPAPGAPRAYGSMRRATSTCLALAFHRTVHGRATRSTSNADHPGAIQGRTQVQETPPNSASCSGPDWKPQCHEQARGLAS